MTKIWIFIFIIISFALNAEKWVGQVITYNPPQGTPMENGEPFNPDVISAACNGFKIGATVEITNIVSGKKVQLQVTDRINDPANKYFMYLSPAASKEIGLYYETGLVVVEADFGDVNSTDRDLSITGLVAEGTIDTERLKNFPEVEWDGNGSTPETKTNNIKPETEKPAADTMESPAIKEEKYPEQQNSALSQDEDKLLADKIVTETELDEPPALTPRDVMERSVISDMDIEDFEEPAHSTEKEPLLSDNKSDTDDTDQTGLPSDKMVKTPAASDTNIDEDTVAQDTILPQQKEDKTPGIANNNTDEDEETARPKLLVERYPLVKEPDMGSDKETELPAEKIEKEPMIAETNLSDDNEGVVPGIKTEKDPMTADTNLSDDNENLQPGIKTEKNPELAQNNTDSDDSLETPKDRIENMPSAADNKTNEDILDDPKVKIEKIPSPSKNPSGDDYEIVKEKPKKTFAKIGEAAVEEKVKEKPKEKPTFTQQDTFKEKKAPQLTKQDTYKAGKPDIQKIEEYKEPSGEWTSIEPKGIYVRFYSTSKQDEAENRLFNYKKIFPGVKGYFKNNLYILVIGPVKEENSGKTLKTMRDFGFRDAYIVRNK